MLNTIEELKQRVERVEHVCMMQDKAIQKLLIKQYNS